MHLQVDARSTMVEDRRPLDERVRGSVDGEAFGHAVLQRDADEGAAVLVPVMQVVAILAQKLAAAVLHPMVLEYHFLRALDFGDDPLPAFYVLWAIDPVHVAGEQD